MQVHYLEIMVKREESKAFGCVWMCLDMFGREIRERRERICPEIAQNLFVCVCVQNEGFRGYLWTLACLLRLDAPCWCAKSSWRPYKVH